MSHPRLKDCEIAVTVCSYFLGLLGNRRGAFQGYDDNREFGSIVVELKLLSKALPADRESYTFRTPLKAAGRISNSRSWLFSIMYCS